MKVIKKILKIAISLSISAIAGVLIVYWFDLDTKLIKAMEVKIKGN